MSLPSSDGPEVPSPVAAVAVLPRASADSPAAVLLVERATRCVVHANDLAVQLAPGVALPAPVDDWSDAAGLRDMAGEELSESGHPLSHARGAAAHA